MVEREGGHWRQREGRANSRKQALSEQGLWGELLGRDVVSECVGAKGTPPLGMPRVVSSPNPAGTTVATLRPGRPEVPAAAESCFCAAAPAPVSLTLEPAAYLSNSEGNSAAAADGKKITSAAERGGKRPQPGPRRPPATRPSPLSASDPRSQALQQLRASHCPPARRPVGCFSSKTRLLAVGRGPQWLLQGKVTCVLSKLALTSSLHLPLPGKDS